jgi:hypothetical protein
MRYQAIRASDGGVNITLNNLDPKTAERLITALGSHVMSEEEEDIYWGGLLIAHSDAEWYAAHDRSEDPRHYHSRYVEPEIAQGYSSSLNVAYAAGFARQLNEKFGDEDVGYFSIRVGGRHRTEWRPADAEPGSGVLAWMPPLRRRGRAA